MFGVVVFQCHTFVYANGKNDTDSDGLTDWEEIRKNIKGFLVPMMIESSTDKYGYTGIPKFVDALMCRTHSADDPIFEFLKSKLGSDYDDIMQLPCLILNSDPTKADSDGDGIVDKRDPLTLMYSINVRMNDSYKDSLYNEVDKIIDAQFNFLKKNKNIGFYSTKNCVDIIFKYDKIITDISNKYFIHKAAVQSILLRELRCCDVTDEIADYWVEQQYIYQEKMEEYQNLPWIVKALTGPPTMPIPYKTDSSTGYGQIFARTAIDANNWANKKGMDVEKLYNYDNWKERKEIWEKLKNDNEYNIRMVALVLIWGAAEKGLSEEYWCYNDYETKTMLTRYNGFGNDAIKYGNQTFRYYQVFDKYNQMDIERTIMKLN